MNLCHVEDHFNTLAGALIGFRALSALGLFRLGMTLMK